jgi:hypothetical protein
MVLLYQIVEIFRGPDFGSLAATMFAKDFPRPPMRSLIAIKRALSRSALAELDLWRLFSTMSKISYAGYRFPPEIIQQAI